jgi:hypothetical protein
MDCGYNNWNNDKFLDENFWNEWNNLSTSAKKADAIRCALY